MPEDADELTPVQICKNGDDSERDREWQCGGSDQSSRAPLLKYRQKRRHSRVSEFTFQIGLSGLAGELEGNIGAYSRSDRGDGGVLVPRVQTLGNENGEEDVGATNSGDRRAIEDREKKEPECAQVAERRKERAPTVRLL